MKRKWDIQSWLTIIVSVVIMCGLLGLWPGGKMHLTKPMVAEAAASDFTADDAASWMRDRGNEHWCVDVDGVAGCQCVDLAKAYYKYLGYGMPVANGYEYGIIGLPDGWTRLYSDPHPGDLFWKNKGFAGADNNYGHVGLVMEVNGNTVTTVETNSEKGSAANFYSRSTSSISGYVRPNFKNPTPVPDKPSLTVKAGTSATPTVFSWGAVARGEQYDIRIYNSSDEVVASKFDIKDTSYSIVLPNGTYTANVAAVNVGNNNWTFSDRTAAFTVGNGTTEPLAVDVYDDHIYAVYPYTMTRERAKEVCEKSGGHLVTINSKEENDFLRTLVKKDGDAKWYWIGAERSGDAFKWSTGEKFTFSNWGEDEPNNSGDIENYVALNSETFKWNDVKSGSTDHTYGNMTAYGFILEVEAPKCTSVARYNGHMYYLYDSRINWTEANAFCKSIGGELVTVNDANENKFITDLIQDASMPRFWIGLNDSDKNGKHTWISGEKSTYTNWGENQPDATDKAEYWDQILKNGKWNDVPNFVESDSYNGFICEMQAPELPKTIQIEMGQKYVLPEQPGQVSYVSSDETKIIVSKSGVITPIKIGTATVTVMYGDDDIEQIKVNVTKSSGDINMDGEVSAPDVMILLKWLHAIPNTKLTDSDAADINDDGIINIVDLSLLKSKVIEKSSREESDWVLASKAPKNAEITAVKYTYDLVKTEEKTSSDSSMEGWTLKSSAWKKSKTGTYAYANYPSGFDTENAYYKKYEKSAIKASESATAKREVSDAKLKTYIYWHWNYLLESPGPLYDRYVSDNRCREQTSDGAYHTFDHFSAFESTTNLTESDGSGQVFKYDTGNYDDVSWWWYKLPVYEQTYTDYNKEYTYTRTVAEKSGLESETDPTGKANVGNVQKWVKYEKN